MKQILFALVAILPASSFAQDAPPARSIPLPAAGSPSLPPQQSPPRQRVRTINDSADNRIQRAPDAQIFTENVRVKLTGGAEGQPQAEFSILSAGERFSMTAIGDAEKLTPAVSWQGLLYPQEDGSIVVQYSLALEVPIVSSSTSGTDQQGKPVTSKSVQYKTESTTGTVRVKLGEPQQFLKIGPRTWTLQISALDQGPVAP